MTKRSIDEITDEISKCRKRRREIVDANLYKTKAPNGNYFYTWRDPNCVYELNRITAHVQRLFYEKNQAFFRDWALKIAGR